MSDTNSERHRIIRLPHPPAARHRLSVTNGLMVAVRVVVYGSLLVVLQSAVLLVPLFSDVIHVKAGDVATHDYVATSRVTFASRTATQAARDRATQAVAPVFDDNPAVVRHEQARAATIIAAVNAARQAGPLPYAQRQQNLELALQPEMSPQLAVVLTNLSGPEWTAVSTALTRAMTLAAARTIRDDEAQTVRAHIVTSTTTTVPPADLDLVTQLVDGLVQPNLIYNVVETAAARQAAAARVPAIIDTVASGQIIVHQGEVITPLALEELQAEGLLHRAPLSPGQALATVVLGGLLVALLCGYVVVMPPRRRPSVRGLALVAGLLLAAELVARIVVVGRPVFAYAVPLPAVAAAIAVMFGPELGILIGLIVAFVAGSLIGGSPELALYYGMGSVVAVAMVRGAETLSRFLFMGLLVTAMGIPIITAAKLLIVPTEWVDYGYLVLAVIANGALTAMLTPGAVFLLAPLVGVTTMIQLLELSRPTHPLLRRLITEAPGTYHHSLLLGNLAERAATAIGADALLARVGAYYHDVGKTAHPYYFIENQIGENVHDSLPPEISAQLIKAHVTDGLQLAREFHLPTRVQDFIAQHHGTTMARFFYAKAVRQADGAPVDEAPYRYPGPRPQSKEVGIVMLADIIEPLIRSGEARTPEQMRAAIKNGVTERLQGGQLDDCNLTLTEIELIQDAFFDVMRGVFHKRIAYPEIKRRGTGIAAQ